MQINRQLRLVNMFFFEKSFTPNRKNVIYLIGLGIYIVSLIIFFPLLIDFLKTFFFLENYLQKGYTNISFLIVSFIIVYFVAVPFVTKKISSIHLVFSDFKRSEFFFDKGVSLLKIFAFIFFFLCFPFFLLYCSSEISALKHSSQYYSDCKKIINQLEKIDNFDNLNIYVEHTPFLFSNRDNIHSRILPLENRIIGISDLIIFTDSLYDYFYLNREGLLFSKISSDVGIYSNSATAIAYLKNNGYIFSDHFYFEKFIALQEIAKQNNIEIFDNQHIELECKTPLIYNDPYLYNTGNYKIDIEIENKNNSSIHEDIAYIEIHLGRAIEKIFLNSKDFVNKDKINKSITLRLNSLEQGAFISIMSLVNSAIYLDSIRIKKY